jgi:hypothetical protein
MTDCAREGKTCFFTDQRRCLFCGVLQQDAGGLNPSCAGADFTRLSSRDLYGAGSRLLPPDQSSALTKAGEFLRLGLISAARHYFALAALEDAGMGPKTGQSTLQSTVNV